MVKKDRLGREKTAEWKDVHYYKILTGTIKTLNVEVSNHLNDDWILHERPFNTGGSVTIDPGRFEKFGPEIGQAMTKTAKELVKK